MVAIPPAIIFINLDLSDSVREKLIRQLYINEVLDGYVFDDRVAADPSYPDKIRQLNQRVMVVRTFEGRGDVSTWTIPEVVIFVKYGLASVEKNLFGPPGITVPILNIQWGQICVFDRK